jgi:hypothetical protein
MIYNTEAAHLKNLKGNHKLPLEIPLIYHKADKKNHYFKQQFIKPKPNEVVGFCV